MTERSFGVVLVVAAALALTAPARAESLPATHRLPAALAQAAVGEAVATCAKLGYRVTATVINLDGVPIAMLHGDGSGVHTIQTSYAKALATVSLAPVLKFDTSGQLAAYFQQQPGFQPPAGMLFRAGGIAIKLGDEVIGAIGVGGAPMSETCARAGTDKIRDQLQ